MSGTILAAAMLSMGVGYGYQQLPEGGYEYIIQIKPEDLAAMKNGQDTFSDIPPNLRGVRSFRITLRSDPVPRSGTPEPVETAATPPAAPDPTFSATFTPAPPNRLPSNSSSQRIPEQQTPFLQNGSTKTGPPQTPLPKDQEPAKPPLPLLLVVAALLGSLGYNLYLSWITWETRSRYRRMLRPGDKEPVSDNLALPNEDDPFRDLQDIDERE